MNETPLSLSFSFSFSLPLLSPSRCAAPAPASTSSSYWSSTIQSASCSLIEETSCFPSRTPHLNLCFDLPICGTSGIANRSLAPIHWVLGTSSPPATAKLPSFCQQTWRNGVHDAAWSRRKLYGRLPKDEQSLRSFSFPTSNQINRSSSFNRACSSAETESMGRGRGRGKKLTTGRSHEEKGSSGEEIVPARKRRGRPQKRFAEKFDQADFEKFVEKIDGDEEEVDDVKLKNSTAAGGNKRGRPLKEGSNIVGEDNSSIVRSSSDESTRTNGFRQVGSRRKNKPRRAAEAGLECK